MAAPLSFVISLLRFVATEAPHLIPELRKLATSWAGKKGIPHAELLPALVDTLDSRVASVDAAVDAQIAALWGDQTEPGGGKSA